MKRTTAIQWTPDMDAALRDLRAKGWGYHMAADRIGVHGSVVERRVKALGLPTWGRNGGRGHRGMPA